MNGSKEIANKKMVCLSLTLKFGVFFNINVIPNMYKKALIVRITKRQ
jgi:hypothetical protein